MKGSSNGSIYSVDEAGDIDWWAQSDGSHHSSQSEEEIHFCMLSESKVQNQRHEVHQKKDAERGWTQEKFKTDQRKHRQGRRVNTNNRYQALSILETIREEDEADEPTYVFDKSDTGKWIREDAVVDSGAFECVTSKEIMPHLTVEETPESRRGETWTCAGGNEIRKEGDVTVSWRTDFGHHEARCIQSRTGVENTDQCGHSKKQVMT